MSVIAENARVAPTSTGRRPILSASMLSESAPMSTPKLAAANTGPSCEPAIFQSRISAGPTYPIIWTSKPSMISEIMQSAKTRMWSGPIRLFSSTSPMLIVLAAGWVIVRAPRAASRRPLRVPYQTLRIRTRAVYSPARGAPVAARAPAVTAVLSESSSDEIPRVGGWELHRDSDVERTRRGPGGPLRRVDASTRRRQRRKSRARRLGRHSDERRGADALVGMGCVDLHAARVAVPSAWQRLHLARSVAAEDLQGSRSRLARGDRLASGVAAIRGPADLHGRPAASVTACAAHVGRILDRRVDRRHAAGARDASERGVSAPQRGVP